MTQGSIRPPEGALSSPLACTRGNSRPSGPDFTPRWQDTTFQEALSTSALTCPTSVCWHMTTFLCADRDAQLRPPATPHAW